MHMHVGDAGRQKPSACVYFNSALIGDKIGRNVCDPAIFNAHGP